MSYYDWKPYVPVAERRRKAERQLQKLAKQGQVLAPVVIEGRNIARTFWGKAWCENLERYSDYANRLPRGRTYVRNGSVLDLQIGPGQVEATVSGSEIYRVTVQVKPVSKGHWTALCGDCAGAIDSLVELLQGRFSKGVMERICRAGTGLFPAPAEIELACSCPDWATMCKHVAAVLYGIGARLDEQPELLFQLRGVHATELLAKAAGSLPLAKRAPAPDKVLAGDDLAELFGLELAGFEAAPAPKQPSKSRPAVKAVAIVKPTAIVKTRATPTTPKAKKAKKAKPLVQPVQKAAQPAKKAKAKPRAKTPANTATKAPAKTAVLVKAKRAALTKPNRRGVLG